MLASVLFSEGLGGSLAGFNLRWATDAFQLYGGMILWEALAPARILPQVPGWRRRGLSAFLLIFLISTYLPMFWSQHLARVQWFDLTALGTGAGALVGLLVYEAGVYLLHRTIHASDLLWRCFHQWHHSAERLDTYGAFWFSPLDMIGWTVLASLALTLVVGLTTAATTLVLLMSSFLSIVQHANLRTPRWLGYLVQRPVSHSRHHERGVHAGSYSNVALFDLLGSTFDNPRHISPCAGFWYGASRCWWQMLCCQDVSTAQSWRTPKKQCRWSS